MFKFKKTLNLELVERLDKKIFNQDDDDVDPLAMWWVLYVDDKIAGFCGLKQEIDEHGRYGYLAKAGLLPEFRGAGLQREMIKVRDREAVKLGLRETITYTSYENVRSANNLIACGYKLYQPHTRYGLRYSMYFMKRHF